MAVTVSSTRWSPGGEEPGGDMTGHSESRRESHMKRVALVGALALLFLLVPAKLDAQATSAIKFVNATGFGPMDLYFGPSGDATVALGAAGLGASGIVDLGQLPADTYRFVLCVHVASPAPT